MKFRAFSLWIWIGLIVSFECRCSMSDKPIFVEHFCFTFSMFLINFCPFGTCSNWKWQKLNWFEIISISILIPKSFSCHACEFLWFFLTFHMLEKKKIGFISNVEFLGWFRTFFGSCSFVRKKCSNKQTKVEHFWSNLERTNEISNIRMPNSDDYTTNIWHFLFVRVRCQL